MSAFFRMPHHAANHSPSATGRRRAVNARGPRPVSPAGSGTGSPSFRSRPGVFSGLGLRGPKRRLPEEMPGGVTGGVTGLMPGGVPGGEPGKSGEGVL